MPRVLQFVLAAALVWLLTGARPPQEHHWTYRPCNLIQIACAIV